MTWPEEFLGFFHEIAEPLTTVLNAEGCREGWIQGEFYRYFRKKVNGFQVNRCCAGKREKYDLYCNPPTAIVAEVKVYCRPGPRTRAILSRIEQSHPKIANESAAITRNQIEELAPAPGSYFSDVLRLQKLSAPMPIERFMILVLQKKSGELDEFGRRLLAVHLSEKHCEHDLDCAGFLVRISQLYE
jgi:hypothetical protein